MRIKKIFTSIGLSGYYNKDFKAIRAGAKPDGFVYDGKPLTSGFYAITQPGECISVVLMLDDGQTAFGDCVDVIFSAASGRDPIFRAKEYISILENEVTQFLTGKILDNFTSLDSEVENIQKHGRKLHTALRYGISQAILDAVAKARKITMAEIISQEYGTTISPFPIPILAVTPTDQKINIDKMILKEAAYLPHGSFSHIERDLGQDGSKLINYILWVKERVQKLGRKGYNPIFHFDLYGTIGELFSNNVKKIASFLKILRKTTEPYELMIETPIIALSRNDQINILKELCNELKKQRIDVKIIADEWCNTLEDIEAFSDAQACDIIQIKTPDLGTISKSIEAALYCKKNRIGVYIGGSANETDQSARISSHVALATQADILLAKPGQGTDEGLSIEYNEMKRTLCLIKERSYL